MTTARTIIEDTLSFSLNRLSPGETLDADTAAVCLRALNNIVDSTNGAKSGLFREILTAGTVTSATGTLGTTWAALAPGDQILGASYNNGSIDIGLGKLTMAQYQALPDKAQAGDPVNIAYDGAATVFFYPVPSSRVVTLRTRAVFQDFAALDTDYSMPKGYRAAFASLLAEKLAPQMGGLTPAILIAASGARMMMTAQSLQPAVIDHHGQREWDIHRGWV